MCYCVVYQCIGSVVWCSYSHKSTSYINAELYITKIEKWKIWLLDNWVDVNLTIQFPTWLLCNVIGIVFYTLWPSSLGSDCCRNKTELPFQRERQYRPHFPSLLSSFCKKRHCLVFECNFNLEPISLSIEAVHFGHALTQHTKLSKT